MTPETLETLLMDDALGATSPEVHALLAAYLANNSAGESQSKGWQSLAGRARVALGPSVAPAPPIFPRQRLQNMQRTRQLWRGLAISGLAAACLFLGFNMGTLRVVAPRAPAPAASANTFARVALPTPPIAQVQDIWSMDRLRQAAFRQQAKLSGTSNSLLNQARLGGHL